MGCLIELQTNIRNDFISTEKAPLPTRAFTCLKAPTEQFSAILHYLQIMCHEFCVFCMEPLQPTQGSWLVPLKPPKSPKRIIFGGSNGTLSTLGRRKGFHAKNIPYGQSSAKLPVTRSLGH